MAFTKTLIYLALAIALICAIDAAPGRNRGSTRRGDRRVGNRRDSSSSSESRERGERPDFMGPCWFEDVTTGDVTNREEEVCGELATCDNDNSVDINNAEGNTVYRVAFCRLNVNRLLAKLGNGTCEAGEGCFGPFSTGSADDLHFCGNDEEFNIDAVRPCREDSSEEMRDRRMDSSEERRDRRGSSEQESRESSEQTTANPVDLP